MSQNQGLVGSGTTAVGVPDGQFQFVRLGRYNDQIVSELQARFYELCYRKLLFKSFSSAQTLSVAGTAMTGHILWNGATNVNLVPIMISLQVSVTSATMTGIGLGSTAAGAQTTAPTTTTGVTKSGNCFLGGVAPQAIPYTVATTLATTTDIQLLHNTAAINTVGVDQIDIYLDGKIIVPQNTAICLTALGAASAASAVTSTIYWAEISAL